MKRFFLPLLFLFILNACAPSSDEKTSIENYAKQIDPKSNVYTSCEEETILGLTTEGVALKSYYHAGNLVQLEVSYYGETGKYAEEIYLKDDAVVFIKALETDYNAPIYDETFDYELSSQIAHRQYFKDGKMFMWVRNGETVDPQSEEFMDQADHFPKAFEDIGLEKLIARRGCRTEGSSSELTN